METSNATEPGGNFRKCLSCSIWAFVKCTPKLLPREGLQSKHEEDIDDTLFSDPNVYCVGRASSLSQEASAWARESCDVDATIVCMIQVIFLVLIYIYIFFLGGGGQGAGVVLTWCTLLWCTLLSNERNMTKRSLLLPVCSFGRNHGKTYRNCFCECRQIDPFPSCVGSVIIRDQNIHTPPPARHGLCGEVIPYLSDDAAPAVLGYPVRNVKRERAWWPPSDFPSLFIP